MRLRYTATALAHPDEIGARIHEDNPRAAQRGDRDTTEQEHQVLRFTDRFWSEDWPGKRRPEVFYDPRSLEPDGPAGVLHAKAVVADEETVFITSANLTEAALDRNIEVGLVVRDRALAASVTMHFRGLIERELLADVAAGLKHGKSGKFSIESVRIGVGCRYLTSHLSPTRNEGTLQLLPQPVSQVSSGFLRLAGGSETYSRQNDLRRPGLG